ncbi:putative adenosine monophosphate-protein transferase Fic [Enterobacter sp. R1(2018)]|uniref:putative adenosine monophosphate-protein transferase Fic n=1 Tax=Enterobacter sp. R1(2018) TaxID=2447891 RepID=UPI000EB38177|nr:putative adenosine monophosphate-protein transferase Fic [Enterobacter sp. R1(2018)]RKQ39447.1 putative adenosine monophosphate-protein transferase Fic [Enterobacter sp. R1(2018)]
MSDKFGEGRDPYFWSGIQVLRNRLDIRESERLKEAELQLTALRAATIELGPQRMGLPWLCSIHQQLFQDVYDWAGELRKVDIYQGDTRFCHFEYIENEGNDLMQELEDERYLSDLEKPEFIECLAHYYCEINVLHPFRIGSGRAQRVFFEQLAIHAGYMLDWSEVEQDTWQAANQAGALGDLKPLTAIFTKVVSEAKESE